MNMNLIKIREKTVLTITIVFLMVSLTSLTNGFSIYLTNFENNESYTINQQELDLLAGEIIFEIKAFSDVTSPFNISYSVPPVYCDQAPLLINVRNNTNAKIINFCIINDTLAPNKIINFTIEPMKQGKNATFYIDFWVLVKNNEYNDLDDFVEKPKEEDLPENTKIWLSPTKAVQSNNILIKHRARLLKRFTKDNLTKIAEKIASFTHNHRKYLISYKIPMLHFQDAVWSYLFGGVCTGRANLGTALFRANGIPARQLAVMPTWSKDMWFDMHYISQYYSPGYGWVLVETSLGITPYEPKNNVIIRVNYPQDENNAGNWHSSTGTGGVEYWFWTNNEKIYFSYIGPARRAWVENEVFTNSKNASNAFNLTKEVYGLHTKYFGVNLSGSNNKYYLNATLAQKNAVESFKQSNIYEYIENITYAFDQYKKINV